ncbi:MAG TPA: cytidylate kinase family protein [Ktedonobacteraceae bacterium]|nr:cytidylate kinase family protein [Ktedonobacteraceae bacterium]
MTIRAITISGEVATGKSSLADAVIALLPGWKRVNTGQRFRDFSAARGMSIQQVSILPDEVHKAFDNSQRELLKEESNIVVEGRLSGWLAHGLDDVLKVYCYAPLDVRAERYMRREHVDQARAVADIEYRDSRDVEKFKRIYGVDDYRAPEFYDLLVDTSKHTPEELAQQVVKALQEDYKVAHKA